MLDGIRHKARWLLKYLRLFGLSKDAITYYRCRHLPRDQVAVPLRLRGVPQPLLCRPGTSDSAVLWGVFGERFHRAPSPLGADPVIVDLGANVGYTAVDFALCHPDARIVAVEMDEANAELARRNCAPFETRISVLHAAVWNEDTQIVYGGESEWAFRVMDPESSNLRSAPALTVDSILRQFFIDRVDYMKIDIEGGEAKILGKPAAWMKRVRSLKVEVHPPAEVGACAEVLRAAGFSVRPDGSHPSGLVGIREEPDPPPPTARPSAR